MAKRRTWDEVGEIVGKIKELGLSYKEGAHEFGINPWVLYEYNRRQQSVRGKKDSDESSVRAGNSRKGSVSLPEEVKVLIADYRKENPDHGFKRIQDELKRKHLVVVTRKQIRAVLKEYELLEVLDSSFDRGEEPPKGITANVVCPALTMTEENEAMLNKLYGLEDEKRAKRLYSAYPMRRIATSEDIAYMVVFLASNKASYITGQTISVNGGYSML